MSGSGRVCGEADLPPGRRFHREGTTEPGWLKRARSHRVGPSPTLGARPRRAQRLSRVGPGRLAVGGPPACTARWTDASPQGRPRTGIRRFLPRRAASRPPSHAGEETARRRPRTANQRTPEGEPTCAAARASCAMPSACPSLPATPGISPRRSMIRTWCRLSCLPDPSGRTKARAGRTPPGPRRALYRTPCTECCEGTGVVLASIPSPKAWHEPQRVLRSPGDDPRRGSPP